MNRVAQFERVAFSQFALGMEANCHAEQFTDYGNVSSFLNNIVERAYAIVGDNMPKRKTKGSAGYDFTCPFNIELKVGESVVIPTGLKCRIEDGWALKLYPRSGLGFKYICRLANTVGIIDADYYNNKDNEGHIMVKLTNDGNKVLFLHDGDSFAQGIFEPFGITEDDEADGERVGGIGSTGK